MKIIFYSIILIVIASCGERKNSNLLTFKTNFHRELTEKEMGDNGSMPVILPDSTSGDTLFITALLTDNGCMEFEGDIEFRKDTIFLLFWQSNQEACKELIIYNMEYKILNVERRKYTVKLK